MLPFDGSRRYANIFIGTDRLEHNEVYISKRFLSHFILLFLRVVRIAYLHLTTALNIRKRDRFVNMLKRNSRLFANNY